MRYLYLVGNVWHDKNNGDAAFDGVVPRDCDVGDEFEREGGVFRVTEKTQFSEGSIGISSYQIGDVG